MTSELAQALHEAAERTLEDMCFMYPTPELESRLGQMPTPAYAKVRFSGPSKGRVEVHVALPLLPVLAENMLGLSEPVDPVLQYDALGELANVICGNVLPALGGQTGVFDLAAPETGMSQTGSPFDPVVPAAAVRIILERGPATALLYVDRG